MEKTQKANRLIRETSPYLRQHAHNPVDWYSWGPEALAEARRRDCPIFLSIGYSACHWCHVMERESFEDPAIAAKLNEHFVNIKVDREERPDLDQIYMSAVQLMTHHGGWPMSVWLTPDGRPFFGGTYFPPAPRHGLRGFPEVIAAVAEAWKNRRAQVEHAADSLTEDVGKVLSIPNAPGELQPSWIADTARKLERAFDRTFGGIGRAPKFPHSVEYRLMLRAAQRAGRSEWVDLVALSLERMSAGGIYDQLGGGFHRYATDDRWLVPHFEKMLYDNALIPLALLEAYQATGNTAFLQTVRETLDYVLREMTGPAGGFYSSQDADSEGREGKFFVWSRAEIEAALDPQTTDLFCYHYDVTSEGNWEGANILHRPKSLEQTARMRALAVDELAARLADARARLFALRQSRVRPGTDEKVLVAWNGLMIDALATAAQVLDEPRYTAAAISAARLILDKLRTPAGLLHRTYKDGTAKLNGYLEDYAALANALVSVYEASYDPHWIEQAVSIVRVMLRQFWDDEDGGFFFIGADHEKLITRSKDAADGATPSGNALAATALARLWRITGNDDWRRKAEQTLLACRGVITQSPLASGQLLLALGVYLGPTYEFVVVGDPDHPETRKLLRALHARYLPNKVVALRRPEDPDSIADSIGLFAGRPRAAERPTVYICKDFVCKAPIVGSEAFAAELERLSP